MYSFSAERIAANRRYSLTALMTCVLCIKESWGFWRRPLIIYTAELLSMKDQDARKSLFLVDLCIYWRNKSSYPLLFSFSHSSDLIYLPIKRWNLNDRRPTNSMCTTTTFCLFFFVFFSHLGMKRLCPFLINVGFFCFRFSHFSFERILVVIQFDTSLFLLLLKHFRKELTLVNFHFFLFPVLFCSNFNLIPCFVFSFFLFLFGSSAFCIVVLCITKESCGWVALISSQAMSCCETLLFVSLLVYEMTFLRVVVVVFVWCQF